MLSSVLTSLPPIKAAASAKFGVTTVARGNNLREPNTISKLSGLEVTVAAFYGELTDRDYDTTPAEKQVKGSVSSALHTQSCLYYFTSIMSDHNLTH